MLRVFSGSTLRHKLHRGRSEETAREQEREGGLQKKLLTAA